jgi:hypothetical protein
VIALDDAALARLAIASTAVPRERRRLQRVSFEPKRVLEIAFVVGPLVSFHGQCIREAVQRAACAGRIVATPNGDLFCPTSHWYRMPPFETPSPEAPLLRHAVSVLPRARGLGGSSAHVAS